MALVSYKIRVEVDEAGGDPPSLRLATNLIPLRPRVVPVDPNTSKIVLDTFAAVDHVPTDGIVRTVDLVCNVADPADASTAYAPSGDTAYEVIVTDLSTGAVLVGPRRVRLDAAAAYTVDGSNSVNLLDLEEVA